MASNAFMQAFAPYAPGAQAQPVEQNPMDILAAMLSRGSQPPPAIAVNGQGPIATPMAPDNMANILQALGGGDPGAALAPAANTGQPPKQRRSLLDIIGGVADTFASVGGADPLYRMGIDAQTERARQVDVDAMRREQFEMQQRTGEQGLEMGGLQIEGARDDLEGNERERHT